MSKENILVSVFKKLEIPSVKATRCGNAKCTRINRKFHCTSTKSPNASANSSDWSDTHLREITEDFVGDLELVRTAFANRVEDEVTRPRRFAGLIAAGISLLTSAFSGVSTYTLSQHISNLHDQFGGFKGEINSVQNDIARVHNGVVSIIDDFSEQLNHKNVLFAPKGFRSTVRTRNFNTMGTGDAKGFLVY